MSITCSQSSTGMCLWPRLEGISMHFIWGSYVRGRDIAMEAKSGDKGGPNNRRTYLNLVPRIYPFSSLHCLLLLSHLHRFWGYIKFSSCLIAATNVLILRNKDETLNSDCAQPHFPSWGVSCGRRRFYTSQLKG